MMSRNPSAATTSTDEGNRGASAATKAWIRVALVTCFAVALLISDWPPRPLGRLSIWLVVLIAFAASATDLFLRLDQSREPDQRGLSLQRLLRAWIGENQLKTDDRRLDLYRRVFYNGKDATDRMARYALLMAFASIIATAGILADSTAVVIGAMLVAPLITPMMGMALGLTMGWQSMLTKATGLVAAGIAIAIGTGYLLSEVLITAIDIETNTQIASRSTPTLVDLVIAIAAGGAGSYALSRPDVSSSLPGVAIAIALVPPLAVVGVLLNLHEWSAALGAGLLFATNLVCILITGGVVFLVTGAAPIATFNDNQHRVRVLFISLGIAGLVVVGALASNGAEIARDALDTDVARATTQEWLGESSLDIVSLDISGDLMTLVLAGADDPVGAERLARELGESLGRSITVDLQWIPRNRIVVVGD